MHVQSCCFAYYTYCSFRRSRCRRVVESKVPNNNLGVRPVPSTQKSLLMKICAQGGGMEIPELLSPSHGLLR